MLDLFESEAIVVSQEEAGMSIYTKTDENGIKITLSISIYENECAICLSSNERLIFETMLQHVESLRSDGECLRIHVGNSAHDYLIYFKPNLYLKEELIFL